MTPLTARRAGPARDHGTAALGVGATVAIVAGFADLVRGGITIGPVLLVIAYCGLIPAALWRFGGPWTGASPGSETPDDRPPYLAAGITFGVIFAMYVATLAPSTAMWDTSEYIAAAYVLGLPHPPGNPFFVLLGRVVSLLPIAPSIAVRLNLLAAVSSALSAALWFLVTERACVGWLPRWQRLVVAGAGALLGATAFTVWTQSVVNEKVYTVSLALIAVVSWLMVRWSAMPDGRAADARLLLVCYLLGLGYANHMAGMLPAPAAALVVLMRRPRMFVRWRLWLAGAALALVGLTPFATQPIRAAYQPAINEGEPTGCRNGLQLGCTFSKATADAFIYNFNREQYGKPSLAERQAPFTAQLGMWWWYFRWQWIRDASEQHAVAQGLLASLFLVLAACGGWAHARRDRSTFWYFAPLVFLVTPALVYYLNFRYGASQSPELNVLREVRDRDYFFIWSFSALSVWIALGIAWLWESAATLVARGAPRIPMRVARTATAPLLACALIPLVANWSSASRRGDLTTIAFAHDLLNSVEPYAVLITAGDNDTFPLWYAQEVEGIRRDVTVGVLSLMNTDWYARAMIRRPIYEYDAAKGPAIYRGRAWPKPTTPPIHLSLSQADSIPPYVIIREPVVFERDGIRALIDPRRLRQDGTGGGILERADVLVLRMLRDSWPERPLYISRTTGGYAQQLGLTENVVTRGLAQAIVPAETQKPGFVRVDGEGWFDVETTRALWEDVFRGPRAITDRNEWIDRPSVNLPFAYLLTGDELAQTLRLRGDRAKADKVSASVTAVARAIGVDRLLRDARTADVRGDAAR